MTTIERIVTIGLSSLRNSLWDDPECYWPQEGFQNGLPERNLSIHVAHLFLKHDWLVFAEASYPNRTDRRIDFLAIKKGTLVAGECKQLDMADRAGEFADDIRDIQDFRLTTSWNTNEWQASKITERYGLLLAVTWSEKIKSWWKWKGHHNSLPRNISGQGWQYLGRQLDKIDAAGNTVYGEQWLHRTNNVPDLWALYATFPLPKRS